MAAWRFAEYHKKRFVFTPRVNHHNLPCSPEEDDFDLAQQLTKNPYGFNSMAKRSELDCPKPL